MSEKFYVNTIGAVSANKLSEAVTFFLFSAPLFDNDTFGNDFEGAK